MMIMKIKAATAAEASKVYAEKRDASGLGASEWPDGEWNGCRISYNAKVWKGEWPEAELVYNPYAIA